MRPCFSLGGTLSSSLILGFIGGYPVGAATIMAAYDKKYCSKKEAERALAFCNNCGPAFILATVGNAFFNSPKTGILLLTVHIFSAILTGIIFKFLFPIQEKSNQSFFEKSNNLPSFSSAITNSVSASLKSIFSVSAYIVFFSVFLCVLHKAGILAFITSLVSDTFGFNHQTTNAFIIGVFEMTSGIFSLSSGSESLITLALVAFLLGWGGFSVHFQTQSIFSESDIDLREYYIGKFFHGILSFLFALFISGLVF